MLDLVKGFARSSVFICLELGRYFINLFIRTKLVFVAIEVYKFSRDLYDDTQLYNTIINALKHGVGDFKF
jgi:hypothetical protein